MTQNFIRNRWLNHEGRTVSGFHVYGIADSVTASRDGSPNWDCGCLTCHRRQVFTHSQVSGGVLYCSNGACSASRVQHQAESSIRDLRRTEREQREQAKREAVERQRIANEQAARIQAQQAALEPFKADWHRYSLYCIKQGQTEGVLTLERFAAQGDQVRERIMDIVARNGG